MLDNAIALRLLYMLVQPFKKTEAFKLGIIDENGKNLIPSKTFTKIAQRKAYTPLHRFVFNMKRLLAKLPGGDHPLKSLAAALILIKESESLETQHTMGQLREAISRTNNSSELLFLEGLEETNVTGADVATDQPIIRKKKSKKNFKQYTSGRKMMTFEVDEDVFKRFKNGKQKYKRWAEYLDLENEEQRKIYDFAKKNPKGIITLKNGANTRSIRFNRNGGGKWKQITRSKQVINQT